MIIILAHFKLTIQIQLLRSKPSQNLKGKKDCDFYLLGSFENSIWDGVNFVENKI